MAVLERIPEKLIVGFVTLFITWLQLTTNFYSLGPALGGWTTYFAQKILLPLNIPLISIYVNYYLACTTDPGSTPEGWEPPYNVLNPAEDQAIGLQFCKKCDAYKPPRSHHCKYCGKCILRMDHHCPWIGNCVGFGNYAHFVRFVFSVMGCCSYGAYLLLWRLQRIFDARKNPWMVQQTSRTEMIIVIINLIMIFITLLLVGVLAIYHTYCLYKGQTTIEGWERTKTIRLVRRKKIDPVEFPFDTGVYANICSVLGNNPLLWCWPSASPGDGLTYKIKENTMPYHWPPKDPKGGNERVEQQEREQIWRGPKLVRRDSEGYLVKEITMEDRMKMLNAQGFTEHEAYLEQDGNGEQEIYIQEEEYLDEYYEEQEVNPDNEFDYDSNSDDDREATELISRQEDQWVDED